MTIFLWWLVGATLGTAFGFCLGCWACSLALKDQLND
mgnify:FL=1|jgi:hypothetical protein